MPTPEPLRSDVSAPLPLPVIYDQTAQYNGWFQGRDPRGAWLPTTPFQGGGFNEYTATTWHGRAAADRR